MKYEHNLINFLNSLETKENTNLMEAIHSALDTLLEARILPEVTLAEPDTKLKYHQFKMVDDTSDKKTYLVATRNSEKKLIGMYVQIRKVKPEITGTFSNDVWLINFVQKGQEDFNVTNSGSIDAFNSVFAVINHFINENSPAYIAFKATDADPIKASQKSRLYGRYLNNIGYNKVDPIKLPDKMKVNEVYGR